MAIFGQGHHTKIKLQVQISFRFTSRYLQMDVQEAVVPASNTPSSVELKVSYYGPGYALRLPKVEAPRISRKSTHDSMRVFSAGTRFYYRLSRQEEMNQRKLPMSPIGNRTRDLPFCSSVPQPTAPSLFPSVHQYHYNLFVILRHEGCIWTATKNITY